MSLCVRVSAALVGALLEDHSKHSQSVAAKAKDKIVESKTTTASIDDLLHELIQVQRRQDELTG